MARPKKNKAEYFPHYVKEGRTISILEDKYSNDGYACWFKLLEILCDTEGQVLNYADDMTRKFFAAKAHITEDRATDILNTLADMGKIDRDLWREERKVWVQTLMDNLQSLYDRRRTTAPQKPQLKSAKTTSNRSLLQQKPQVTGINCNENPQSKGEERKEEERKGKKRREEERFPYQEIVARWNDIAQGNTPKVKALSDTRKAKIRARLQEFGKPETWLPTVEEICHLIADSDFLSGRTERGWLATFDWVFENPTNWVKIVEGNYANHTQQRNSKLGVGEFIDKAGNRTYGSGQAIIPQDAPPRPGAGYYWNATNKQWAV